MNITTRFNIGDSVVGHNGTKWIEKFVVGQIRVQTLSSNLILIEYRSVHEKDGRRSYGRWYPEREVRPAH